MKRQQGDVLIAVVMVVVVALAAGGGYWTWRQHEAHKKPVASTSTGTTAPQTKATAGSSAKPATTPVAGAACSPTNLVLSQGSSDGTAGTIYKHAVVTNNGTVSCTISGYPTVSLLDAHGAVLGSSASDNALYPAATITLAAGGGKAHVVLGFPDAGAYGDPAACTAASTTLQLVLPGGTTPLQTAWIDQSCPEFSTTVFQSGE
ncbi:MAG TPA: DUF4232 domain-containing protein [Candidatus Saccharimonadales bacterium]|nr:DUF4232 domain-containing protein [Candidatus Saccharimonadales bacterium]